MQPHNVDECIDNYLDAQLVDYLDGLDYQDNERRENRLVRLEEMAWEAQSSTVRSVDCQYNPHKKGLELSARDCSIPEFLDWYLVADQRFIFEGGVLRVKSEEVERRSNLYNIFTMNTLIYVTFDHYFDCWLESAYKKALEDLNLTREL